MQAPAEPTSRFDPNSSMVALMQAYPGAKRALFSRYHLGGCQSCAYHDDETLASLCSRSGGLDPMEVLEHLALSQEHDLEISMEPAAAKAWLAKHQDHARLIDLRTREEFEAVRIPGAQLFTSGMDTTLFSLEPSTPILLYDHLGIGVLDQVAWFRGHQMKNTFGLRGGIDAWSMNIAPQLPRYRIEVD